MVRKQPAIMETLLTTLRSPFDWRTCAAAAEVLGELREPRAIKSLEQVLMQPENWNVEAAATLALKKCRDARGQG